MARKLIPYLIYAIYWLLKATLRWELDDRSGLTNRHGGTPPSIWAFWHNRILGVTAAFHRFIPWRKGTVLTSASKDGAIIAGVMRLGGLASVRGSTSRRGTAALMGAVEAIRQGCDIAITPDGPRGPVYSMAPGVFKLAELSGAPIIPVWVEYDNCWRLKTWDRFCIPKPFSKVRLCFGPPQPILPGADIEEESRKLRAFLKE